MATAGIGTSKRLPEALVMKGDSKILGTLGVTFTLLFNAGLCFVSSFGYFFGVRPPYFPGPLAAAGTVVEYFTTHSTQVLMASFLQFGAAVLLGIFTVVLVARLRSCGASALASGLALLGGILTSFDMAASNLILWVIAGPGMRNDPEAISILHRASFAFGGPAFSVTIGLLFIASSMASIRLRLLPKWVVRLGIIVGSLGVLSWFTLLMIPMGIHRGVLLIPLTRFPGFVWIIAAGFELSHIPPGQKAEAAATDASLPAR